MMRGGWEILSLPVAANARPKSTDERFARLPVSFPRLSFHPQGFFQINMNRVQTNLSLRVISYGIRYATIILQMYAKDVVVVVISFNI
jgi:hypothetical protein